MQTLKFTKKQVENLYKALVMAMQLLDRSGGPNDKRLATQLEYIFAHMDMQIYAQNNPNKRTHQESNPGPFPDDRFI